MRVQFLGSGDAFGSGGRFIEAGRDADLFIVEALSFDKKIPHHLDYAAFHANAPRIGAKRVILTHMGPQMLANTANAEHLAADDGMVVEV